MSKKMKIPSIFLSKEAKQPWQWPSCKHPKTLSFRERGDVHDDNFIFKTVNSVFLDPLDALETSESIFTNSNSDSARLSSTGELENNDVGKSSSNLPQKDGESLDFIDTIIHGVRSTDRLFFDPDDTGSLLKEENRIGGHRSNDDAVFPFKQSVALTLDSDDPYLDFKKSMQEMVETHGLKDWDCLEELLGWYLKVNEKTNHGIIVGAFIDVLIGSLGSTSCTTNSATTTTVCCSEVSSSYSSAESCFSSPSSPVSPKKTSNAEGDVTSQ